MYVWGPHHQNPEPHSILAPWCHFNTFTLVETSYIFIALQFIDQSLALWRILEFLTWKPILRRVKNGEFSAINIKPNTPKVLKKLQVKAFINHMAHSTILFLEMAVKYNNTFSQCYKEMGLEKRKKTVSTIYVP